MIWHPPLLCAGSCAGRETCSRAWRKNHHSSPGLHLRPGPSSTGEEEQEEQTAHRATARKRERKADLVDQDSVEKKISKRSCRNYREQESISVYNLEPVLKRERVRFTADRLFDI